MATVYLFFHDSLLFAHAVMVFFIDSEGLGKLHERCALDGTPAN